MAKHSQLRGAGNPIMAKHRGMLLRCDSMLMFWQYDLESSILSRSSNCRLQQCCLCYWVTAVLQLACT